ncbi:hypothetical protein L484_018152 [Morus notabilis]|uniref:Uncharacterized protein n=1 Tax=Morus notabilis TaxID=981085 RepID=W9R9I1_9ROSA|nr:hypothetical protein L484_018152 [Morus notabilis]
MVHKRFTMIISFFLGLLFVMHGLMGSSAHAHEQDKDIGLATLTGGRKLMGALKKEIVGEGPKMNNGAGMSKISGSEDMKASNSLGSSQESSNSQLIAFAQEGAIQESTDHDDHQQHHDESTSDHQQSSTSSVILNDETRRLLEAAKEIVSLMHKDYKGMGRRKPPINNHEPSH